MQSIWSPSIATHLTRKAGYTKATAHPGAVTLIQRFGSALNLNIHFHMLFLDGVYVGEADSSAQFRWVKAPTNHELTQLTHTIVHRLVRYLERQGLLERDAEHSYLALEGADEDPMDQLRGHSITYRIAMGSQQGRKVFTLQTLPDERDGYETPATGNVAGFSQGQSTRQTGAAVPLHYPPCDLRETPVPDESGQGSVLAENPVSGWHDPRDFRAGGLHCQTGGPGAETQSQLDAVSRCICSEQQTPSAGDASQTGQGQPESDRRSG